jgi:D-alanyl-D-alanine-carboxypeptidase/D-alanyl-D-alanine-endopeptidase
MKAKPIGTVLFPGALVALVALTAGLARAADASPAALLEARFHGDRTGACLVAATIDHDAVVRSRYCARSGGDPAPGFDAAFEIGSITKTMTAFLVADLVDRHLWTLDDPIVAHLPPGAVAPRQGERQILVRDLLTHRSGLPTLPSRMHPADGANPYATLTEADLLQSLAETRLTRPIGSTFEYSNFAMMVLSLAVTRAEGGDLEGALRRRLFEPLRMDGAGIEPASAHPTIGHLSTGAATSPWTIATDLAGFGMVHATLDDMVRYAQAELGDAPPDIARKMRLTRRRWPTGSA